MASPMILSTRPPNVSTIATNPSKQSSTTRFTCSGSVPSDSDVNPTRSANSTVTTRRWSLSGAAIWWPQLPQNRLPSGTASPQEGQVMEARIRPGRGGHDGHGSAAAQSVGYVVGPDSPLPVTRRSP